MAQHTRHDDMLDDDADSELSPKQILNVRARVHRMADRMQTHESQLTEHRVEINGLKEWADRMATKQQLTASIDLTNVKLEGLGKSVAAIETGIRWVVGLVITGVILAVLALVLKQ